MMQCVAVCCSALGCVAVFCSLKSQEEARTCLARQGLNSVIHCVALCCNVLYCVAVYCSVMQ